MLGAALYEGLTQVGLPYLQSLLYPMNMSSAWLGANRDRIPEMMRSGYIGNDLYALQNLMESFVKLRAAHAAAGGDPLPGAAHERRARLLHAARMPRS